MSSLNNIKRNKVPSLSGLIHVWNTQEGVLIKSTLDYKRDFIKL